MKRLQLAGLILALFSISSIAVADVSGDSATSAIQTEATLTGPQAAMTGDLFIDAPSGARLEEAPAAEVSMTAQKFARERFVLVNFPLLKSIIASARQHEALPLHVIIKPFADQVLEVVIDQVEVHSDENVVLSGSIAGFADSAFTLVLNQDAVVAAFRLPTIDRTFEVSPLGNGLHSVHILGGKAAR